MVSTSLFYPQRHWWFARGLLPSPTPYELCMSKDNWGSCLPWLYGDKTSPFSGTEGAFRAGICCWHNTNNIGQGHDLWYEGADIFGEINDICNVPSRLHLASNCDRTLPIQIAEFIVYQSQILSRTHTVGRHFVRHVPPNFFQKNLLTVCKHGVIHLIKILYAVKVLYIGMVLWLSITLKIPWWHPMAMWKWRCL